MALQLIFQWVLTTFGQEALQNFYELVTGTAFSSVYSTFSSLSEVETDVNGLRRTYEHVRAILTDADERRYIEDDSVRHWLCQLKDIYFDADDLLDEFQTYIATQVLTSRKRKRSCCGFFAFFSFLSSVSFEPMLKRRRIRGKITEIRDSINAIAEDRKKLRLKRSDGRRKPVKFSDDWNSPQQSSIQDNKQILGRDEDLDAIVELLVKDTADDLTVIPIYGTGGLGKTTLARLAFSDRRIKIYFKLRMWVSVLKDYDVARTTKEIIVSITKKKVGALSLDVLQCNLVRLLTRKRFLLVLDNVWSEGNGFWDALKLPLHAAQSKGSKVLVTTRSRIVCNIISRELPYVLNGLKSEHCLSLFMARAFASGKTENRNLMEIGEQIVNKCQGSPLAAKCLGTLLYEDPDEDEWRSVLNEMWELEERENGILQTLKVSYDHLPLHLKQCFAYSSIFPAGHELDKDELVKQWIAVGLVQPRGNRRLEAIGGKYFDQLLWRSFFQVSDDSEQLSKKLYTMPSLIQDLAQLVSSQECLRIGHNAKEGSTEKARYAFFTLCGSNAQVLRQVSQYESMRTFMLKTDSRILLKQIIYYLLPRFKCLRVLDLRNNQLEQLPDSIGNLKHLRYLGLYNTKIKGLPESVSDLYNLQNLELGECYQLLQLPKGLSKLVNLRHLGLHIDWNKWTDLNSMPPNMSDLKSLQTLSRFAVSRESGCTIRELKGLSLRGELCISKLENIANAEDAQEAKLENKQYIETLMLRWSRNTNLNVQNGINREEVIKHLCPHHNLKHLHIENYNDSSFPPWLANSSFVNLESITLSHCKRCTRLPPLDQLPQLRNLVLRECNGVTALPQLNCLHTLEVERCNEQMFEWLCSLTGLSSLTISRCEHKHIPKSSFQQLTSLRKLKIEECNELVSIAWKEDLQSLVCLESLEISSCPKLMFFSDNGLPPSVRFLHIHCCEKLKLLPGRLHAVHSLHCLKIVNAPNLKAMPVDGLPLGLQNLEISGCPSLKQQCQQNTGPYWPKIASIPNLIIDD